MFIIWLYMYKKPDANKSIYLPLSSTTNYLPWIVSLEIVQTKINCFLHILMFYTASV